MARFRSTAVSFRSAAARIAKAAENLRPVPPLATRAIAEEIMTDVKASRPGHGVPVHTGFSPSTGKPTGRTGGTLRASGIVDGPDPSGVVSMTFGGAAAPYALVQHERLDYQHNLGEARYLVRGIQRWRPNHSAAMVALRRNAQAALAAAGRGA